jgi:ribosomal-protein-alanine N-acetyltransferase
MILRPVGLEACFTLADLHDRAFDRPWSAEEFESLLKGPGAFAVLGEAGEPEEPRASSCAAPSPARPRS